MKMLSNVFMKQKKGDEWVITGATGAKGPISFVEKQFSKVMNVISSVMKEAENIK